VLYGSFGLPILAVLVGPDGERLRGALVMDRAEEAAQAAAPRRRRVPLAPWWLQVSAAHRPGARGCRRFTGRDAGRPAAQHPRSDWHLVLRLQAVELCHRRLTGGNCRRAPSWPFALYVAYFPQVLAGPSCARATSCPRFEPRLPEPRGHAAGRAPGGRGCSRSSWSPDRLGL